MKIFKRVFAMILCSIVLSMIPLDNNKLFSIDFITDCCINLFGISLAIFALLLFVVEKHKEYLKQHNRADLINHLTKIMHSMGENTLGLLVIIILLFLYSIIQPYIILLQTQNITNFNINFIPILFVVILIFYIMVDTTLSTITLINHLNDAEKLDNKDEFHITEKEAKLINTVRKLDKEHFAELLEYIKTLIIKQELTNNNKKNTDSLQ